MVWFQIFLYIHFEYKPTDYVHRVWYYNLSRDDLLLQMVCRPLDFLYYNQSLYHDLRLQMWLNIHIFC